MGTLDDKVAIITSGIGARTAELFIAEGARVVISGRRTHRCLAAELGEHGVRVNCISPGPILTGIFAKGAGIDLGQMP